MSIADIFKFLVHTPIVWLIAYAMMAFALWAVVMGTFVGLVALHEYLTRPLPPKRGPPLDLPF